jgi:hypothetical protein
MKIVATADVKSETKDNSHQAIIPKQILLAATLYVNLKTNLKKLLPVWPVET